jgi:hypothetical protein
MDLGYKDTRTVSKADLEDYRQVRSEHFKALELANSIQTSAVLENGLVKVTIEPKLVRP